MATTLSTIAEEGSTYIITVSFSDDAGDAATPDTMTWTLTDTTNTVINSREDIDYEVDSGTGSAGVLGSSMDIVLNGDDLTVPAISIGSTITYWLLVEGTYTSDAGSGLPWRSLTGFKVENLPLT